MKGWVEIFTSGTHTSSQGKTKEWSLADLDKMVQSYAAEKHEAPIVIGHPKNNDPAFGWVEGLKRSGDTLLAKFKQVVPEFAELVKDGRFKKRSISVYPDGSLRHVGFLGAQPPAIKGLRDIEFSDSEADVYEFGEEKEATMPKTVEELERELAEEKSKRETAEQNAANFEEKAKKATSDFNEQQAKTKSKEIDDFIENGIKEGKILPAWEETGLSEFMKGLDSDEETYEFSEGKKETKGQWFKNFISSFSEHPLFKEMKPKDEDKESDCDFAEADKIAEEMAESHRVES